MAASLLAAMWRLRIVGASQSSLLGCRSIRSRPPVNFFPGEQEELESDGEEEDNLEQDVKSALKRRQKAILLKRMKREMEPPGPPERHLTWSAMQQIRYLRQEFPEEWPLSRLAVGFNVSTDAIKKVLKSKFIPSEARRIKQDAAAFRAQGKNSPGFTSEQLQLGSSIKHPAQLSLPLQENTRQLLSGQTNQLLPPPKTSDSSEFALSTAHLTKSLAKPHVPQVSVQAALPAVSSQGPITQAEPDQTTNEEDKRLYEERWDREVLSDQELEELAYSGVPNNMKVVQKGKEFYDGDGNFLYRI